MATQGPALRGAASPAGGPVTTSSGQRLILPSHGGNRATASLVEAREQIQWFLDQAGRAAVTWRDHPEKITDETLITDLDSWHAGVEHALANAERLAASDPGLGSEVRRVYTAAVQVFMSTYAAQSGKPIEDLYVENHGRIAPFAWFIPHRRVAGVTPPLPMDAHATSSGAQEFAVKDALIRVMPDEPAKGDRPYTNARVKVRTRPDWRPQAVVVIRTFYPGLKPGKDGWDKAQSGYGRGITQSDMLGGSADPWSRTTRFHEGQHAMDIVDYLRSAEFPVLLVERPHGAVNGERYLAQWKAEWEKLIAKAMLFSAQRTDCAGWLRVDNSGHDPWGIVCQAHGH